MRHRQRRSRPPERPREIPKHEDNEATIAELKARIEKTIAYVKSVDASKISGAENSTVTMKFPSKTFEFTGKSYLTDFVLPISTSM